MFCLAITCLFELFSHYKKASGAKLNQGKCHGLLIGAWKNRSSLPVELLWTNKSITVFGSIISNDGQENWPKLTEKYSDMGSWKQLNLMGAV